MVDQLSPRRLYFLEKIITGLSVAAAYRAAGFKSSGNESRDGARILKIPEVRAKLVELQAQAVAKAGMQRQDLILWLSEAILTPAGAVDENHSLAQQVTRHYHRDGHLTRVTIKTVDKLKAADQLAILLGWFKQPSKVDTRPDRLKDRFELGREREAPRPNLPDNWLEDIAEADAEEADELEALNTPKPPKKSKRVGVPPTPGSKDISVLVSSSPPPPQPATPPPTSSTPPIRPISPISPIPPISPSPPTAEKSETPEKIPSPSATSTPTSEEIARARAALKMPRFPARKTPPPDEEDEDEGDTGYQKSEPPSPWDNTPQVKAIGGIRR